MVSDYDLSYYSKRLGLDDHDILLRDSFEMRFGDRFGVLQKISRSFENPLDGQQYYREVVKVEDEISKLFMRKVYRESFVDTLKDFLRDFISVITF